MNGSAHSITPLYPCGRPRLEVGEPLEIALLGATGSIGRQTIDVVRRHGDRLRIAAVAVNRQVEALDALLAEMAEACPHHEPPVVAVGDPEARERAAGLPRLRGRLLGAGLGGLVEAVELPRVNCVVNALVGAAGLEPTLAAARRPVRIALANKESLVVGGRLVREAVEAGGSEILPVDSEHAAIAQCLSGRSQEEIEKLIVTASGGPFRETPADGLRQVTREQVLAHPTWSMGPKITVDSATLMNKGLELIEAHHLFGLPFERIDVVVHPASIVHSLVCFRDGALLAQLGQPDMRVPLQYAMTGEKHWPLDGPRLDLAEVATLHFEAPDEERFPCLRLARQAGAEGGRAPVVLNAANEVAVAALLSDRLPYHKVADIIARCLDEVPGGDINDLEEALAVDDRTRALAANFIST